MAAAKTFRRRVAVLRARTCFTIPGIRTSMSFQASNLRIAGQDLDTVDIFFPSFEVSGHLPVSPMPSKQMYGTNESILSWIDAIDRANKPIWKPRDDVDVFEFATHPFRACPHSPFLDDETDSDISFCFAISAGAPEALTFSYYDDSDESPSESFPSDDAQYIDIPYDSPWYCKPSPSLAPVTAYEFSTAAYAKSCSSDVRQAIAQQELLLAIFHTELRRIVPRADGAAYNFDWLEDVDVDLVLSPLETYADLCWESAVHERSGMLSERPTPDVPIGFDTIQGAY